MNWLPLIWLVMALVGVAAALYAFYDSHQDDDAMRGRNGTYARMRGLRRMRILVSLVALAALVLTAVLALIPGTSDPERLVVYLGLYVGTGGLILNVALEPFFRELLRRML